MPDMVSPSETSAENNEVHLQKATLMKSALEEGRTRGTLAPTETLTELNLALFIVKHGRVDSL